MTDEYDEIQRLRAGRYESFRSARTDKARRMIGDNGDKVDASDWTPGEPMNADIQTGMRPISRRAYKSGGKVDGEKAERHAGRKPRAAGGKALTPDNLINRNVKEANEERPGGKAHVGGYRDGGKTDGKWIAGAIKHPGALHKELHVPEGEKIPAKKLAKAERSKNPVEAKRAHLAETLKSLPHRAAGGRAKGKMNVNVIIDAKPQAPTGALVPGMPQPPVPSMPPTPPVSVAPPAMPQGAPMPQPAPVIGRKSGGRAYHAGAGSGEGRLEKIEQYGDRA